MAGSEFKNQYPLFSFCLHLLYITLPLLLFLTYLRYKKITFNAWIFIYIKYKNVLVTFPHGVLQILSNLLNVDYKMKTSNAQIQTGPCGWEMHRPVLGPLHRQASVLRMPPLHGTQLTNEPNSAPKGKALPRGSFLPSGRAPSAEQPQAHPAPLGPNRLHQKGPAVASGKELK